MAAPPTALPGGNRITRTEFYEMFDAGVFGDRRLELIDGRLIDKLGQKPRHARTIRRLTSLLAKVCPDGSLQVQGPIELFGADREYSEPEPDFYILGDTREEDEDRHPRGDELFLASEVSDTSVRDDLTSKRDLYARGGVPEYWVVVHRGLRNGVYGEIAAFIAGETVSPALLPGVSFPVEQLLPA
ncbi:MAG: Uma2 family endonuclease [Bryobacteraceae bacterium]